MRKQRSYKIRNGKGEIVYANFAIPVQEPHEDFRDEKHKLNADEQLESFGCNTIVSPEGIHRRCQQNRICLGFKD